MAFFPDSETGHIEVPVAGEIGGELIAGGAHVTIFEKIEAPLRTTWTEGEFNNALQKCREFDFKYIKLSLTLLRGSGVLKIAE